MKGRMTAGQGNSDTDRTVPLALSKHLLIAVRSLKTHILEKNESKFKPMPTKEEQSPLQYVN